MPRNQLGEARQVVKQFCAERGVPYYKTSIVQSFTKIVESLHEAGGSLRAD